MQLPARLSPWRLLPKTRYCSRSKPIHVLLTRFSRLVQRLLVVLGLRLAMTLLTPPIITLLLLWLLLPLLLLLMMMPLLLLLKRTLPLPLPPPPASSA